MKWEKINLNKKCKPLELPTGRAAATETPTSEGTRDDHMKPAEDSTWGRVRQSSAASRPSLQQRNERDSDVTTHARRTAVVMSVMEELRVKGVHGECHEPGDET